MTVSNEGKCVKYYLMNHHLASIIHIVGAQHNDTISDNERTRTAREEQEEEEEKRSGTVWWRSWEAKHWKRKKRPRTYACS